MRRRFSRRGRRPGTGEGRAPIDAAAAIARILEEGIVEAGELVALERDDVPDSYAALARGVRADGTALVVSFSPLGGDALLGALAAAMASEGEGGEAFSGEAVAIAPVWTAAGLQRLGQIRDLPFRLRAVSAPTLQEGARELEADRFVPPIPLPKDRVAAGLGTAAERMLFERAASALEGLASKHGGSVRGTATTVELVIMARRVAELRADAGVTLETLQPQRASQSLTGDDLSGAFDRLEGQLRKRLNDRRVRDGEEGLRTRAIPLLVESMKLRAVTRWPVGGSDREVLDLIGVDEQGHPVAAAIREELDLEGVGELLDMSLALQPVLALLLAEAEPPLRLSAPRIAIAAQRYTPAAAKALAALSLGHALYELRSASRGLELAEISSADAIERAVSPRAPRGGGRGRGGQRRDRDAEVEAQEAAPEASEENDASPEEGERGSRERSSRGRSRGRGRRGRGRRPEGGADGESADGASSAGEAPARDGAAPSREAAGGEPRKARPIEVSLFDLDDESDNGQDAEDSESRSRRGRGRGRRRGRRGGSGTEEGDRPSESRGGREERDSASAGEKADPEPAAADDDDDDLDLDDSITALADDAPDFEAAAPEPKYDEEEDLGEEDGEAKQRNIEREKRRRARRSAEPAVVEAPRPPPRRRVAILACADRDSLISAILLARDLRLVEGIWVYPQSELMTFFRGVVTDQREDTPLHVIGFTPSPAGEVLRTIPLYADRLHWYDHHAWPPEDLGTMRSLLPDGALHLATGAGSSLPAVLGESTRRSRFSDKLVDLCAGRFSQHDYERWGRLWWHRLGEIVERPGDRRADVDALLVGRPSDLAKEAARVDLPPIPPEVTWVSERDFRIVHFAGYSMVVLDVEAPYDALLAARIARERYSAQFSLVRSGATELFTLGAEEASGKRSFDLGGMLDHLGSKLDFVTVLADEDHIARFELAGLDAHPDRLDEVVSEIAMGRSTLES